MKSLSTECSKTFEAVKSRGTIVRPTRWQSMDVSKRPEATTLEVLNHTMKAVVDSEDLQALREAVQPNLPWADDHFSERIGGKPLNPGVEWAHWPWGNSANSFRRQDVPTGPHNPSDEGRTAKGFDHSYMERYWPKYANRFPYENEFGDVLGPPSGVPNDGVRFALGDLTDVVAHLLAAPDSRQAYLPVWFPEDTGKLDVRVPCTLGYHFIQRHGYLHCVYYIRSCDLYRHFRDDVYLTVRLQLWVLDQLRGCGAACSKTAEQHEFWRDVRPGTFTMHITSLHCFINDAHKLWPDRKWSL